MGLKGELLAHATETGLDLAGVTTADPFPRLVDELDIRREHYRERYAHRIDSWKKLAAPRDVLPGARSVVVIGFYYLTETPEPECPAGKMGRIVGYGHLGILRRARSMQRFLKERGYKAVIGAHRKEAAIRAGLGSLGKNNLVLNPTYGTWVAYQSLVTDAELEPDQPSSEDACGDCRACLDACPTRALYEPRRVDPRKCVTCMLTSRDIAEQSLPTLNAYILGCDACQEACPRNRNLRPKPDVECLLPDGMGLYPPLDRLLRLTEADFQRDVIGFIRRRIMQDTPVNRLMNIGVLRKLFKWLSQTVLKGREVLPETFVHASGNLAVYRRNAIVAAGHLQATSLRPEVERYTDDPYLGPYARWTLERLKT